MKVGLIARCDDRGLGHVTWEFARAMRPDVVLVVTLAEPLARGFVQHVDRYDFVAGYGGRVLVAEWDGGPLPSDAVWELLRDVDVVYSAETFYDPGLVPMAEAHGTATVLHSMPEFHRADLPSPTATWLPTGWRADVTPHDAIVPVPVALDRFGPPAPPLESGRVRWLHVAGNRAAMDRNGTSTTLAALRHLRRPARVELAVQRGRIPRPSGSRAEVVVRGGAPADYWRLYDGVDALVLPRRYGGLCLPAQEAMAAGMAVVLPGVSPNDEWPAVLVGARKGGHLRTSAGLIDVAHVAAVDVARAMDSLADPDTLARVRALSRAWAELNSWERLAPVYRAELARVAE